MFTGRSSTTSAAGKRADEHDVSERTVLSCVGIIEDDSRGRRSGAAAAGAPDEDEVADADRIAGGLVDRVMQDVLVLRALSGTDDAFFARFGHRGAFRVRAPLRAQLQTDPTPVMRAAIRKALAGPPVVDHARIRSYVGRPMASLAVSIYVGALYDLNRRIADGDQPEPASDRPSPLPLPLPLEEALDLQRGHIAVSGEQDMDPEWLFEHASRKLASQVASDRRTAIVFIAAIAEYAPPPRSVLIDLPRLAASDPSTEVRAAAAWALERLEATPRRGGA